MSGPPDIKDIFDKLVMRSSTIHAAFLFVQEGISLRQKLCLLMSATRQSNSYLGWEALGYELGLDSSVMKVLVW